MFRQIIRISAILAVAAFCAGAAGPYEELVPKFSRIKSNAMVRKIDNPTIANMDYAAYDRNPVLFEAQKAKPKKPSQPVTLESITFGSMLSDVKNTITETPLTDSEMALPMAWRPLAKKLWEVVKEQKIQNIASKINGYKWEDPNIYQAYQEIATAYLHGEGAAAEVWVKVEFSPWVGFLNAVTDEDKDGIKEIYGKLSVSDIPADSLQKAYDWIRTQYLTTKLSKEQLVDWITDLASYWYPTKNSDIIDMTDQDTWPNAHTKKVVFKTLKGLTVKNPVAVVEAKPFSPNKPIFNVYVVESASDVPEDVAKAAPVAEAGKKKMDERTSKNYVENNARIEQEIKKWGDFGAWAKSNAGFFDGLKKSLGKLPPEQMGFKGKDDWVFFRKSVDYVLGGDLAKQAADKNPIPHLVDFQRYLKSHDVHMLFVAVPNKEEIYFDQLPSDVLKPAVPYVNPYSRKFIKDAQAAGIEIIDLLPAFLKAKEEDSKHKENVYQRQDTHWTNRGLQIAADLIAARVKEYSWYGEVEKSTFTVVDTTFSRQGDIVDKMPEADRPSYPPVVLNAQKVFLPDGKPYKAGATAPLMLIGDSFTGVFESVDCKSAGVGAHLAAKTGIPVDIITSWGGGPLVRQRAVRAREKDLPYKRCVVYLMVARDLYNYAQSWEPFPAR